MNMLSSPKYYNSRHLVKSVKKMAAMSSAIFDDQLHATPKFNEKMKSAKLKEKYSHKFLGVVGP